MKSGWEIQKLSDLVTIFNGNSINEKVKKEKYAGVEEGLPYIGTKDVSIDSIINYDNGVKIPNSEVSNFKIAPKNTVLICSEGGSAGKKIGFTEKQVCFGNKLFALVPKKNIDIKFVYYFLYSDIFINNFSAAKTGVIGGVSINKFKDISMPVPSLDEQNILVRKLDNIFSSTAQLKVNYLKNKINSAALFESYMHEQYSHSSNGSQLSKLGEVIKLEYGKPLLANLRNEKGLYPVYGANGIKSRSDKYLYDGYSIIVGRKGSAGEVTLTEAKFWPLDVTYYVTFDNNNYDLKFVYYLLLYCRLPKLAKGIKPGINRNDAYGINVYIPNLLVQKKIVSRMDNMRNSSELLQYNYKNKLSELNSFKKSILKEIYQEVGSK